VTGGVAGVAGIHNGFRQAIYQANTPIHGAKHQGAQVRGYFSSGKIGANRVARSGRESELFWGKIGSRAGTGRHFLRVGV